MHLLAQSTSATTTGIGTESPHGPFTLENVTKETGGSLTLVETKDDGRLFFDNFLRKNHFFPISDSSVLEVYGMNSESNKKTTK